jgi:hypothetical protein
MKTQICIKFVAIVIFVLMFINSYSQNFDSLRIAPNPFITETEIYYGLANNEIVSLTIYNRWGEVVKAIIKDSLISAGYYSVRFHPDSLVDGIYIVALNLGSNKTLSRQMFKNITISIVENFQLNKSLKPYPNPTNNLLTIPINGIKNIVFTDLNGKICKTIKTTDNTISIADLKSGNYLINIFLDENILMLKKKIIKSE